MWAPSPLFRVTIEEPKLVGLESTTKRIFYNMQDGGRPLSHAKPSIAGKLSANGARIGDNFTVGS